MAAIGKNDYSLDSLKLTGSNGKTHEIKDLVAGIDFYESLLSPYIKCELAIIDSANLLEMVPIIGQEKIELVLTESNKKIKKTFYVGSVNNFLKANLTTASYTLSLITPEQMRNSLTLVSQAFPGTISETITKIVNDYLKSKIKVSENTSGVYNVIIPNWKPFQAIDWLSRRAINTKQIPFAFYETVLDGYAFESYETMFSKQVYDSFMHKPGISGSDDSAAQAASFKNAMDYDFKEYSTTYKNTLRGAFSSALHTIDIGTRTYKKLSYDYSKDFNKKKHLDKVPYINDNFKIDDKKITDYESVHYVVNKNSNAYADAHFININNEAEFTKLESDPFIHQLSLTKISLSLRGRLDLTVGKVIEFDIEKNKPFVYGNAQEDNAYVSGKYLVLNVHHKMANGKYVIILDAVRDSFGKKVKK